MASSERYADFRMRVEYLIGSLGIIAGRDAVLVLNDILASHSANGVASESSLIAVSGSLQS